MSAFVFVRAGPGEPIFYVIGGEVLEAARARSGVCLWCHVDSLQVDKGPQALRLAVGSPEDSGLLVWRVSPPGTVGIICP